MKSFRFPLQRVLDWRGIQLRTEEERLAGLQFKLAGLDQREKALLATQANSEALVRGSETVQGLDLRALAGFQVRVKSERAAIENARTQCQAQIAEQRKRLLKARKDCRVLEQLKEKRHRAWTYLGDRELEETAAESYISSWLRANADR